MIYEIKIKITILYEEVLKKIVLTKFGRYTDYAYLQYQTSYGAKEYVHQVLSKYLNYYSNYCLHGWTDGRTITRNSTRLDIVIIYIHIPIPIAVRFM